MQSDLVSAYRATRRSYEVRRLLAAAAHAALVTTAVAALCGAMLGARALVWLPVTFVVTALAEWRGMFLMKGARRGVLAGLVSMIVPLSILRPCCGVDAKAMGI